MEQYAYGLKNTITDEKTKDKVTSEDKETLEKAIEETTKWVETNENASTEEFEAKNKELEGIAQPIIMKIYQDAGAPGGGMPDMSGFGGAGAGGAAPSGGASSGPKVEEVD